MKRLRHVLRIGAIVHIVTGPLAMVLLFVSGPWVIGDGRVQEFLRTLEGVDWRWLALVPVLVIWGLPIVAISAWLQARRSGADVAKTRSGIERLLLNRQLPIAVDVDARVPVQVEAPLRIPIELDTKISIDEYVDIETVVPIRVDLPLDTVVETSVFGIGALKIPIRATIPLNLSLPIKGKIRVKSEALPVKLKDECIARLPVFEVPIRSRFETRIDLLDNLRTAEKELRKGVDQVLAAVMDVPPKLPPS
ncbi:MAG: hypothetical protein Q8N23_11905 [Archangium sp.]|nr:hypothetical protein [Archangium sp.]MDP3153371.1 hypothetical protein [Archangium sp.]MDP3573471.1 hypothetical protein [Archangium sp.]